MDKSSEKKIKSGNVEISKRYDRYDGKYYTKILYSIKKNNCEVSWDVHIDSEATFKNLSLHSHTNYDLCDLEQQEIVDTSKGILYRIFHQFDKSNFSHLSFPAQAERERFDGLFSLFSLGFDHNARSEDSFKRTFHNIFLLEPKTP